jgi:uncharacterized membrane protein
MTENKAEAKITETKPFHEQQVLWPLTTGYTLLYLGMMVADFALREAFTMPPGMMIVYVALVTAYAGDKEVRRWTGKALPSKWGSVFIYVWFVFYAVAFTIQAINPTFKLPDDLSKVCLQVLGIFFGSKISGKLYSMKQEAKDFETEIGGREDRILALVTEKGRVATGDAAKLLGLSKPTARRIMDKLEHDGKIKQEGVGRGVYYVGT